MITYTATTPNGTTETRKSKSTKLFYTHAVWIEYGPEFWVFKDADYATRYSHFKVGGQSVYSWHTSYVLAAKALEKVAGDRDWTASGIVEAVA